MMTGELEGVSSRHLKSFLWSCFFLTGAQADLYETFGCFGRHNSRLLAYGDMNQWREGRSGCWRTEWLSTRTRHKGQVFHHPFPTRPTPPIPTDLLTPTLNSSERLEGWKGRRLCESAHSSAVVMTARGPFSEGTREDLSHGNKSKPTSPRWRRGALSRVRWEIDTWWVSEKEASLDAVKRTLCTVTVKGGHAHLVRGAWCTESCRGRWEDWRENQAEWLFLVCFWSVFVFCNCCILIWNNSVVYFYCFF